MKLVKTLVMLALLLMQHTSKRLKHKSVKKQRYLKISNKKQNPNGMVYPELGYLDETTYYEPHYNPLYPGNEYQTELQYGNGYTYGKPKPLSTSNPIIRPKGPIYHRRR